MTRTTIILLTAMAVVLVVLGLWLTPGPRPGDPTGTRSVTATGKADSIQDLMMDLRIVPLDGQPAKPFALASLDGRPVALADLQGRPLLLYFWASW